MGNVLEMPLGEPRPPACREARRVAMTAAYEALDSLIAELHQLRTENRRLNRELAAARTTQRDSSSSVSPLVGFSGHPVLW